MSLSYSRYDRQQRRSNTTQRSNTWNYWLPVGITIASAAIGLAVWAWNERGGEEYEEYTSSDDDRDDPYAAPQVGGFEAGAQQQTFFNQQSTGEVDQTVEMRDVEQEQNQQMDQQAGMFGRMSGAIRRTPSPRMLFDGASKGVAAGVAAAGAAMGKGLTALKETDEDFQDHERWSDEAEMQGVEASASRGVDVKLRKKRVVCVVISAAQQGGFSGTGSAIEHTSILSHLPLHVDASMVDFLVLIYAPQLTSYPLPTSVYNANSAENALKPARSSTASSFSNIAASEAGADSETPQQDAYMSLQTSALRLVPHPTHILPFTTPTGHVHLLRHLSPSLVYMQEDLCGNDGENVKQIEGWVGQCIVVVGGEGLGVDTETEAETDSEGKEVGKSRRPERRGQEWWKDESRVGLGRTEVVESERFEEDWLKRVGA